MTSIRIGHDISLIEEGVAEDSACVYVEANNGEVSITCAWSDAWAGYKVVREFGAQHEAEALAWDIARNPIAEFDRMGYNHADWFKPAN